MTSRDLTSSILNSTPPKGVVNFLNGDRPRDVRQLQGLQSAGDIDVLFSSSDTIIIDEAQNVPNIGRIVKMLVDANQKTKFS